jgi:hypothetical protein
LRLHGSDSAARSSEILMCESYAFVLPSDPRHPVVCHRGPDSCVRRLLERFPGRVALSHRCLFFIELDERAGHRSPAPTGDSGHCGVFEWA